MSHQLRTAAAGAAFAALALAACNPVGTSAPHTGAAGSGPSVAAKAALDELDNLPVKGRAPKTGYSREEFGTAWSDEGTVALARNSCPTRDDVLARDLTHVVRKDGCTVLTGVLHDPYTGGTISFKRGVKTSLAVQIDHIVPLSLAWQTGAQQLTAAQRLNLANDPENLVAVDGPTNGAKSDADAATWLPPNKPIRCGYAVRQIEVKAKYQLWVTPPEKDALRRVLNSCPGPALPGEGTGK
ncbi:HNH endonuclease family protein [Streptomyces sp. RKAG337]|uniref:HNH endonuclease family protein n=1 Tax=Streptomyces sp. RKAG337 TaxID=2893404 RepID=UPI002033EA97|nr:HNH endonuclease family protein [Streptomyces sp. RKAG337]MCM2430958.1 HNH endonuclease family protein [Streptomyces sp. RKAG337]